MDDAKQEPAKVIIKFFASFRKLAGVKEVEKEIDPDTTVLSLLQALCQTYPKISNEVFQDKEHENLQDSIVILLNGRNIKFIKGTESKLADKDILAIFPPAAGGK
ncbi:MAG: ubiquitin-like small modifier protein 1 [Candidatus Heimdallarchaeota archaeon]